MATCTATTAAATTATDDDDAATATATGTATGTNATCVTTLHCHGSQCRHWRQWLDGHWATVSHCCWW